MICKKLRDLAAAIRAAEPAHRLDQFAAHPGRNRALHPRPVLLNVLPRNIACATVPHLEFRPGAGNPGSSPGPKAHNPEHVTTSGGIAKTRQGMKSLDTKLWITRCLTHLLQLIEERSHLRFAPRR